MSAIRGGDFVGYTMTEFIDNRLDHFFSDRSLYNLSPFNIEDLRDCILLEIIKDAYYEAGKKQSLRANRGSDADDLRMRDSRWMAYAQHYRNEVCNQWKISKIYRLGKCPRCLLLKQGCRLQGGP